jgi:hypothetical protein
MLDYETAETPNVLVTMGWGYVCPSFPASAAFDWRSEELGHRHWKSTCLSPAEPS